MNLKKTVFYDKHKENSAKLVSFAGYEMPIQYKNGIISEHKAVREKAGLFDVSHMGEFIVTGQDAEQFINYLITNDVSKINDYGALYSAMCYQNSTIVDDLLVYRFPTHFMLVVNASNINKDLEHIQNHAKDKNFRVNIENLSDSYSLLALQGPESINIMNEIFSSETTELEYYHFGIEPFQGKEIIISRTGYTGEDGFELYINDNNAALAVWDQITEIGKKYGLELCGLGCRDTLRLEMGFALYGNDIDETTTPLEAGLGWVVKLKKDDFIGKEFLVQQKKEGLNRKLKAFQYDNKLIPRHNYPIVNEEGSEIGNVTSGCFSPMLEKSIGMGYIYESHSKSEEDIYIKIRNQQIKAELTRFPFYKKAGHK